MSTTEDTYEEQRLAKVWLAMYDEHKEFDYRCDWEKDVYVTVEKSDDNDMFGATTTTYTDRSVGKDAWIKSDVSYSLFNMI